MLYEGIILKGVGGHYLVTNFSGKEGMAQARGIFRNQKIKPLPGDSVQFIERNDPLVPFVIEEIMPRKNVLVRPAIANLEILVLVFSFKDPKPDLYLLDKLLIIAKRYDIDPIIFFSKSDLIDNQTQDVLANIYKNSKFEVLVGDNTDETSQYLLSLLKHKRSAFAGQSGVGKSTLLNRIFGQTLMQTGEISKRLNRGKHTTRHAEFFKFYDCLIADTPGFSSLQLWDIGIKEDDVVYGYPEIVALMDGCFYNTCRHLNEPKCAVLNDDTLDPGRFERYQYFRKELIQKQKGEY